VPRRSRKAGALYRYAVRDAFGTRLMPHEVNELDCLFRARQGRATEPAPDPDLTVATGAKKFGAARFRALQRRWKSERLQALWSAQSTTLGEQLQRRERRVQFVELSRQYLQLTPLVRLPKCVRLRPTKGDNQESIGCPLPFVLSTRSTTPRRARDHAVTRNTEHAQ
jgi:hypothetical protein